MEDIKDPELKKLAQIYLDAGGDSSSESSDSLSSFGESQEEE